HNLTAVTRDVWGGALSLSEQVTGYYLDQPAQEVDPVGRQSSVAFDSLTGLARHFYSPPNPQGGPGDTSASHWQLAYTSDDLPLPPNQRQLQCDYRRYNRDGTLVLPPIYEGQVTRITYAAGTGSERSEYLGYDGPGNLEWVSRPYRLASGAWAMSTVELSHDA